MIHPRHRTELRVRYAESDQMGYAHHSVFIVWFEQGRVDWLRERGFSYRELEAEGIMMPVASLQLRYLQPARFDDALVVTTELVKLGRCRIEFHNQILRCEADGSETLLAEGQVVLASVGRHGRPIRLPDPLHAALAQHRVEA